MYKSFHVLPLLGSLLLALFLQLCFNNKVSAQEASLRRADGYFDAQDYHTAASMYEQLLAADKKSGIAMFKAGVCYLFTSQPEKGLAYIRNSASMPLEMSPYYYFWLGRSYHLNMRLDSALINYRRYLATSSSTDEYRKGVENYITQAHRTESFFVSQENSPIQALNLGENINSPYTERTPLLTSDGRLLIYTSRRPLYPDELPATDGEYAEKTMMAIANADGSWGKAVPIFQPSDRKSWYSAIQLVDNDNRIILYLPGKNGGLFAAERTGDTWRQPYRLNERIKGLTLDQDVCFAPDMKQVIFERTPLGSDTRDIYIAEKGSNGEWKQPRKLAPLNTVEDEIGPFFSADGKAITFASKGHAGTGGFDLYRSNWNSSTGTWSEPENLGYPINSPGNDIYYIEVGTGSDRTAYISSARAKGFGEADIYKINFSQASAEAK
jgi:tetratricopeptide (TPR) repeat protein